ncbi:hypothetical protein [Paenibacillus ferrarius]|uniref:hypothetical protein n=1 Tax=Paenibacillus ferrarius TaxID=1469647 RepID=UPI003D2A8639
MQPERLIYTFVSYAASFQGRGVPVDGIYRIAELAHRYQIPVTWIVDRETTSLVQASIQAWHEQFGDSVILACPAYNNETELITRLASEWTSVAEAFPWVTTKVLATGFITNELIQVMESQDFQGLWGYCWQQSWWDGISHRGVPWGFWYIDPAGYKRPQGSQIVAIEWTARDLNLALHTDDAVYYSTDPNDVLRAGLCTGDNIAYWQKLFDEYLHNTQNNDWVFFTQQQESHEMDASPTFLVCSEADIEESARMLENFWAYIAAYPIRKMNLPDAVDLYCGQYRQTAPSYMLTEDCEIRPALNAYTMLRGGIPQGPWPETFLYYDTECQLAFIKGKSRPHLLRNYRMQSGMETDFTDAIPETFVHTFEKSEARIEIHYVIETDRSLPFGLVYWDDLSGYRIQSCKEVIEAVIIEDKCAFIRFNLKGESKSVHIILEKTEETEC